MESLAGKLLIADPRLPDSNFYKTVVFMIAHSDEGATGLILNRPSSVQLSAVWEKVSESQLAVDQPIFVGGPVEGPLAAIHDNPMLSEQKLLDGFHLSMRRENLDPLLIRGEGFVRVFSGYSGWSPGQLESEMRVGGWLTLQSKGTHFSVAPDDLYQLVCNELGQQILFGSKSNLPNSIDPSSN